MQLWILLGCVVVFACGGNPAPELDPDVTHDQVALSARIENRNAFSADVYAYRSGRWTRLGLVAAGSTRTLIFLWDRPEVQFVIELIGNDEITNLPVESDARKTFAADAFGTVPCHLTASQPIEPGLILTLQIPPALQRNAGGSRCQRRRGRGGGS